MFWNTNLGKTIKVAGYLGGSAIVGYAVATTAQQSDLFGPVTGIVNLVAVYLQKTFFDDSTPNLGLKKK